MAEEQQMNPLIQHPRTRRAARDIADLERHRLANLYMHYFNQPDDYLPTDNDRRYNRELSERMERELWRLGYSQNIIKNVFSNTTSYKYTNEEQLLEHLSLLCATEKKYGREERSRIAAEIARDEEEELARGAAAAAQIQGATSLQYYDPQQQYYDPQQQYYDPYQHYYDPQQQYYDPQMQYYNPGGYAPQLQTHYEPQQLFFDPDTQQYYHGPAEWSGAQQQQCVEAGSQSQVQQPLQFPYGYDPNHPFNQWHAHYDIPNQPAVQSQAYGQQYNLQGTNILPQSPERAPSTGRPPSSTRTPSPAGTLSPARTPSPPRTPLASRVPYATNSPYIGRLRSTRRSPSTERPQTPVRTPSRGSPGSSVRSPSTGWSPFSARTPYSACSSSPDRRPINVLEEEEEAGEGEFQPGPFIGYITPQSYHDRLAHTRRYVTSFGITKDGLEGENCPNCLTTILQPDNAIYMNCCGWSICMHCVYEMAIRNKGPRNKDWFFRCGICGSFRYVRDNLRAEILKRLGLDEFDVESLPDDDRFWRESFEMGNVIDRPDLRIPMMEQPPAVPHLPRVDVAQREEANRQAQTEDLEIPETYMMSRETERKYVCRLGNIEAQDEGSECPICMNEELQQDNAISLACCGFSLCMRCVYDMAIKNKGAFPDDWFLRCGWCRAFWFLTPELRNRILRNLSIDGADVGAMPLGERARRGRWLLEREFQYDSSQAQAALRRRILNQPR